MKQITLSCSVDLVLAIVGVSVWFFGKGRASEVGKILFACALLALLLTNGR